MIREAVVEDARRIAEIEVEGSRFAYKNIVPEESLYNDFTVENRTPNCERWISQKYFDVYVYEDSETGVVKGMMGLGMSGDEDKKDAFELHFLYVDPVYERAGIGTEMLKLFEKKGMEKGCSEFVIWVLEENKIGKNFYEKNNYRPDGSEKIFMRWNKKEIRYIKKV